jgi:hypothetical protein
MIQNFSGQALQPHVHAKISWHHFWSIWMIPLETTEIL